MCATVPLCVSTDSGPSTALESKLLMIAIDSFFRLMGRQRGARLAVPRGTNACSSDRTRQPDKHRAAQRVLFPAPGKPGKMRPTPFFERTAACNFRYSFELVDTHQFIPHSRKA